MDDAQLLQAYTENRSEEAFRELVLRHVSVVHGTALRKLGGDTHLAEDVTQRVFISLAQKARTLRGRQTLIGWLYTAARLEAARTIRTEMRRRNREQNTSYLMHTSEDSALEIPWSELKAVLDDAMAQLAEIDREAVLLRFFSSKSFGEVGHIFEISEEAARKRVDRAVEKLRKTLGKRGIASTSAVLCASLTAHAAPNISPAMVTAVATHACQKLSAGTVFNLGVFMSSIKLTSTVAGLLVFFAAGSVFRDITAARAAERQSVDAEAELANTSARLETARNELAVARRQLAEDENKQRVQAVAAASADSTRPYLVDPVYRELARGASQAKRHLEFQRFYRRLSLSEGQIRRFEEVMVQQDQANLDAMVARDNGVSDQAVNQRSGAAWSSAMQDLLGHDGMKQLKDYLRSMPVRNFVDTLSTKTDLTGKPVTLEQTDRLTALALANDSMYQKGRGTDPGTVDWGAVWDPATKVLSQEQLATFQTMVEVWSLQKQISLRLKASHPNSK